MPTRLVRPRFLLLVGVVLLATGLVPRPARAQLSTDAALLAKLLFQEQQAVSELTSILTQLQQAYALSQQALTTRPESEIGYALGILRASQNDYNTVVGSTQSIGFQVNAIHNAFVALYPPAGTLQTMSTAQYDTVSGQAQAEVLASSEIAARAQTSLAQIQTQTEMAMQALQNSNGLETITGQIQLVLQLVSVMQADFAALIQNLAATGRVLTNDAAGKASGQQMAHERTRRNRLHYTDRGQTVSVPNKLP
jgi:hypothetical protein